MGDRRHNAVYWRTGLGTKPIVLYLKEHRTYYYLRLIPKLISM